MPVGKAHIYGGQHIPGRLAAVSVPSVTFNVQTTDPGDEDYGNEWYRPDCNWNPERFKTEFGFKIPPGAAPAMDKPVMAGHRVGNWNSFDSVLVIP